jgi:hypothetical protein
MGEIIVHKKAYTRRAYTRKDGTRVQASHVPASTFKVKDRGAPGRTPKSKQWAKFETFTGWQKTQSSTTRRSKMLAATDKRSSLHDRYVEAGRMLNQLANVTTDRPTERKARADANYFFRRGKETK